MSEKYKYYQMIENPVMPPYQELVLTQLKRFTEVLGDSEPLVSFASRLEGSSEVGKPFWWLPFSEKPVPLDEDDKDILNLNDEALLDALEVPGQYKWIRVEREMVVDSEGKDALVERVYFCASSGERELGVVAVLSQQRKDPSGFMTLSTHDMRDKGKTSFIIIKNLPSDNPRILLKTNTPIVTTYGQRYTLGDAVRV